MHCVIIRYHNSLDVTVPPIDEYAIIPNTTDLSSALETFNNKFGVESILVPNAMTVVELDSNIILPAQMPYYF